MNETLVLHLGRRTLETALLVATPVLLVAIVVGVTVALLQAVTSIRDMTLGTAVKLGCMGLAMLIFGGWMMETVIGFTQEVFVHLQTMGP